MSGITAIPLATVIATILNVEAHHARVDAGLVEGIRPDDSAVVFYMAPVGSENKKVIVNRGVVVEVDEHSSVLKVEAEFLVLPGYSVEFEVPMSRISPLSIFELARHRLVANRSAEGLSSLIETLVPDDEFVERRILEVIEARRRRRGTDQYSTRPSVSDADPGQALEPEVSQEMATVVRDWAQAWSDQRVDDYLAHYSRGFLTPESSSRKAWEDRRRQRISRPRFIKLSLEFLRSRFIDSSRGWIEFRQSYWSNSFSDTVTKRLEMIHEEGTWKILQEKSSK